MIYTGFEVASVMVIMYIKYNRVGFAIIDLRG